jgi:hypothetical protein
MEINLKDLVSQAEAGRGRLVQEALAELPFQEKLCVMHKIASCSGHEINPAPALDCHAHLREGDTSSGDGYLIIELGLERANRPWWQVPECGDPIYRDTLNLTTGEEVSTSRDL